MSGEVSIKVAVRCRPFAGGDSSVDKRLGVYMEQVSLEPGAEEGTVSHPCSAPRSRTMPSPVEPTYTFGRC